MNGVSGFISELKRRKVFRVAIVYGAVAFVIAQAADIAFPALHLPPWTVTLVVALAILGFPVALVLAWAFEITPDGVVRTAVADAGGPLAAGRATTSRPPRPWTAQRIAAVGGVVVLAAAAGAFVLLGGPFQRGGGPAPGPGAPAAVLERSIAVLPFEDMSPDRDHGWFSDGITEDIHTHLSRIGDLKVIGRTSVLRYAGAGLGAREIGEALGVAVVLEGSVRRSENTVRISTKLVNAATEEQLWAESYDRELTDIFAIQSDIAGQIAEALRTRITPEQQARLAAVPTENIPAYDLFLRGREHAQRLTREDIDRSIVLFRQALALDPDFVEAHAALAFGFGALQGYHGAGRHWLDSAEVAARRAIALAPAAAEGYAALALVEWNTMRLDDAVKSYDLALAIRPNDAFAHWGLAFTHWLAGRMDEALRFAKRAVELDPAAPLYTTLLGRAHASLGDSEGAEAWFRHTLELQPDFPWAHQDLLWLYTYGSEYGKAEEQYRAARALLPHAPEILNAAGILALLQGEFETARDRFERVVREHPGWAVPPFAELGYVHSRLGNAEAARAAWRRGAQHAEAALGPGSDNDHWHRLALARIDAAMGDTAAALQHLETVYANGWRGQAFLDLGGDPLLAPLRGNPRFEALRNRIRDDVARMRARVEREGW